MTGRMSLEQAKAIKAKRDFDQEMSEATMSNSIFYIITKIPPEDVLEFAGKHSSAAKKSESEESSTSEDSDSDSGEEENAIPSKRRPKVLNFMSTISNQPDMFYLS